MSIETRWVSRKSVVELATLQKHTTLGISTVVRACIDAYRLFDAIESVITDGRYDAAREALTKIDQSKWTPKETVQALVHAQHDRAVHDPFTNTLVAAYKQHHAASVLATGFTPDVFVKIRLQHERYRQAQTAAVEINAY